MWGATELQFLGNLVDSQGIRPLEEKVQAIVDFPQPTSLRKLREFLGLINFYYSVLSQNVQTSSSHTMLSSTANKLDWIEAAITAFMAIKEALATATLLMHPKLDAPTSVVYIVDATTVLHLHSSFPSYHTPPRLYLPIHN